MSRKSPLGTLIDSTNGQRKPFRLLNVPKVGKRTHLSSMMTPRTSISLAATDTGGVSSMMGYAVVAALAIAAIYAITHS